MGKAPRQHDIAERREERDGGNSIAGVANLTLASASAIFSWAIKEDVGGVKVNPCQHVDRMEMQEPRARLV